MMIFCVRKQCGADAVTAFDMPLSGLKWKVKNFTDKDIYVCFGETFTENNVRIAAGAAELLVDRDRRTGTRRTARLLQVRTEAAGEVEILMV